MALYALSIPFPYLINMEMAPAKTGLEHVACPPLQFGKFYVRYCGSKPLGSVYIFINTFKSLLKRPICHQIP